MEKNKQCSYLLSTKSYKVLYRPVGFYSFPVDLIACSFFPYLMTRQYQNKNPVRGSDGTGGKITCGQDSKWNEHDWTDFGV